MSGSEQEANDTRRGVFCEQTHKLLCRIAPEGLWLWCRNCHCEHLVTWERLPLDVRRALLNT